MKQEIQEALRLRKAGKPEEALRLLLGLLDTHAADPDLHYQIAWTYDTMGRESDALGFYEAALKNGLKEDRDGALLGRCGSMRIS